MNFKGKAKRIEDIDLPMIGREIGVGEDEIRAILEVEAAGSGFDRQGRPKMLFEPHIFWRELGPGPKRDRAVNMGLARPSWKRDYPKDSYPRLLDAIQIDEEKALRSASWGLGQIMGFNHAKVGYATAKGMVLAFMDDEDNHLRAMINFIKSAGLADELRRHDWKGFARGYNGPGFAKNGYDRKIAAAFAKWQKITDTPIPTDFATGGVVKGAPPNLVGEKPQPRTVTHVTIDRPLTDSERRNLESQVLARIVPAGAIANLATRETAPPAPPPAPSIPIVNVTNVVNKKEPFMNMVYIRIITYVLSTGAGMIPAAWAGFVSYNAATGMISISLEGLATAIAAGLVVSGGIFAKWGKK